MIGMVGQRCKMQIHDCTAVVDHKMESELYRHETFRLEQFDMSPSSHQPFCHKSHHAGRSDVNQVRFRNHLTHRK